MWKALICLLIAVPSALSECTQHPVVKDIKLKDIEGMWYGQYTLKSSSPEDNKCQRIHFYIHDDGKSLDLTESTLPVGQGTSKGLSFYASGKQMGSDGKFTMSGKLKDSTFGFQYWVLATDYKNYMITSMCIQGIEDAWILTRKPGSVDANMMKKVEDALKSVRLTLSKFELTPQRNCS